MGGGLGSWEWEGRDGVVGVGDELHHALWNDLLRV